MSIVAKKPPGFWKSADGLRVGWAIPLFVVISLALTIAFFGLMYLLEHLTPADLQGMRSRVVPRMAAVQEVAGSCATLIAYAVMCRIDRASWRRYGLDLAHAGIRFVKGALSGALLMSLLMTALVLSHAMKIRPSGLPVTLLISSGLQWAAVIALGAFFEEMLFRGYPFFRLARASNPIRAAIVMSLVFGMVHIVNGGETVIGIFQAFAAGLVFSLAIWRTGSLWWAIGAHAAWNWTQTFVFGCSNSGLASSAHWLVSVPTGPSWLSGGATGPEGSLLVIPIMILMAGVILRTLPLKPARLGSHK
jgi:membrane protease YdiL (CAAX protease family)